MVMELLMTMILKVLFLGDREVPGLQYGVGLC